MIFGSRFAVVGLIHLVHWNTLDGCRERGVDEELMIERRKVFRLMS